MKRLFLVILILCVYLLGFSGAIDPIAEETKSLTELNKAYNAAIENLAKKAGLLSSGADHFVNALYSKDTLLNRLREDVRESIKSIEEARKKGASDEEMSKLLLAYQKVKLRENKQLMAIAESSLYSSMDYALAEGLKSSLVTAQEVVSDFLSNWKSILEPILKGDFKGVLKNAILQIIDSTYKITFIDYVKRNHGATDRIANYWWKSYFVDPFTLSDEKKLVDEVLTSASDELKEKLKEKLTERVKIEIIKKGEELSREALEKTVKEKAEGILKNLIETPSLLIELFAKYYNVVDFQLMFNDLAINEIGFLKEIKRIVGEDVAEINRCYFDNAYFIRRRRAFDNGKSNATEKISEPKVIAGTEKRVLPEVVIEKVEKAVENKDPLASIAIVETIEEEIKIVASQYESEGIPSTQKSIDLIEELFVRLETDEITSGVFYEETQRIVGSYNSALNASVFQMNRETDRLREKGEISVQEYNDRKKYVQEESAKQSGKLESCVADLYLTIEDNKNAFRESFIHVYEEINVKKEISALNSETSGQISAYVELYSLKTGIVIAGSWFASCSDLIHSFGDDKSSLGRDFLKRLYSDSPDVKLIESGWIIEGLDALLGKEMEATHEIIDGAAAIREELADLFNRVPAYCYSDAKGNNEFSAEISGFDSSLISLRNRTQALMEKSKILDEWKFLLEEKNSMTIAYLEASLILQNGKLDIFTTFLDILLRDFGNLEKEYLSKWTEKIATMVETVADLWSEGISVEQAEESLRIAAGSTDSVEEQFISWNELKSELYDLKKEIDYLEYHGVPQLDISEKDVSSELLRSLIFENKSLKKRAGVVNAEFESAALNDGTYDLKLGLNEFTDRIIDYEKYPDNTLSGSLESNIRYMIRSALIQKEGMAFSLSFDSQLVKGLAAGDLEKSLALCSEFRSFLQTVTKRKEASAVANRSLNTSLDSLEIWLSQIEDKGGFTTSDRKAELLAFLDSSVEEATEIFRSYGFIYSRWTNERDVRIRQRIENLTVLETNNASWQPDVLATDLRVIERPSNLIQGELIWLDVAERGYPSQRFAISTDGKYFLLEMSRGSDPSTRFRTIDLSTGEFDVFPLPAEALEIILTEQYRFDWDSDGRLLIFSYAGTGIVIEASGDFQEFSYNAIEGMEFFGHDCSGRYGLFSEPRGKLYVLDNEGSSMIQFGITYSTNTLQWVQGQGTVFFVNENDEIELFTASNETVSKPGTVFSASSCAVLPGGKWLLYGDAFELKALRIDNAETVSMMKLLDSSEELIAGVFPLPGNRVALLWMNHGEKFDYGVQVCTVE